MSKGLLFSALCILSGIGLAATGLRSLRSGNSPLHSRDTFAIQGSAYGKLLARLSETTIDRVWHLGVEQIVPHYMSGDTANTGRNPLTDSHPQGETSTQAKPESTLATAVPSASPKVNASPIDRGKKWIQERVVAQYTRTNPNSLNERHLATVHRDIEKMLLRSFKMDPTHYGAYDSYHLFLTISEFGGSPQANEQAKRIANVAISAAFKENEDPEPWLTAAAAGMNLYLMAATPYMDKGTPVPLELLKEYRNKVGFCLERFDEIQAKSEQSGVWEGLSTERQMEIAERSLFAKRTFKQFDVMIARAETKSLPKAPGENIAKSDSDEQE